MMRTTTNNISRLLNLELLRNQRIALSQMALGRNPLHFLALAPRRLLKKTMMILNMQVGVNMYLKVTGHLKTYFSTANKI